MIRVSDPPAAFLSHAAIYCSYSKQRYAWMVLAYSGALVSSCTGSGNLGYLGVSQRSSHFAGSRNLGRSQFIAVWSQFALYTGCAVKADDKIYHFSTQYFCLDQYSLLISRLGVIGWPLLTLIGFGSGFGGALVLFLTLWRRHARPTISFGEATLRTAADRELDR